MATQTIPHFPEAVPFPIETEYPPQQAELVLLRQRVVELSAQLRELQAQHERWTETLTVAFGVDHKGNPCWLGKGGTCPEKWLPLEHVPVESSFEQLKAICLAIDYGYPLRVELEQ